MPATSQKASPETMAKLGVALRALRSERRLILADVSALSGISLTFISALERGMPRNVALGTLEALARAYAIPLARLLDWDGMAGEAEDGEG